MPAYMDLLEALFSAVVLWRVLLGAIAGALAGAAALALFPALGVAVVFASAFIGASAGVIWLAVASRSTRRAEAVAPAGFSSRLVVFGAAWAIGVLWGGLLEAALSVWLSAVLLAAATPAFAWLAFRLSGHRLSGAAQLAAVLALWLGLFVSHVSGLGAGYQASNPSIERTAKITLRVLSSAAHVER